MKSHLQLLTRSAILALSVGFIGTGCNGNMSRSSGAGAPSTASERTAMPTADADNSRQNVRDRNDATLTPGDQGTTAADRDLTQQVRKSLVNSDSGYSVTARNVKIITLNGKVTLRGPVNSEAEKAGIARLTKSIAGQDNVDDQLEVKTNP